jgi:uncharacterized SAM-binding protein YcdF (DUF218 family)
VFFVLSKLLDVLLCPLTWGVALLAAAAPWRAKSQGQWKRRRALAVLGVAVILVFSSELTEVAMFRGLERAGTRTMKDDVTYDGVILLGGVTDERVTAEHGRPSYNSNVERLTETYRLLHEDRARYAILSGAAMAPSLAPFGEARVLARQLREWGIAEDRLIVEERARNTYENAVYSAEIARERGFTKLVIVTSAFHVRRSVECFEAVGLEVDAHPSDHRTYDVGFGLGSILPRASSLAGTTASFHELFGRVVYRARGYAKPR